MNLPTINRIIYHLKRFKGLYLIFAFAAILIFSSINIVSGNKINTNNNNLSDKLLIPEIKELNKISSYQGLPVKRVEYYPSPNSNTTAIYIPQYHKNPNSKITDKTNDLGVKTQQQIYQIINFLINNNPIDLVITEGQELGQVSNEKIELLSEKIEKRNKLVSLSEELKIKLNNNNINQPLEKNLLSALASKISQIDREITLEGASEKLKAEGENIKLYGSENPQTKEESRKILKDYIYLQDRIKEIATLAKKDESTHLTKSININSLLELLSANSAPEPDFQTLEKLATNQGQEDIAVLLKNIETLFTTIVKNIPKNIMISGSPNTSSREENPYDQISDKNLLKQKLTETKHQLEEVIINRRNKETAENFASALKQEHESIGILQFGAGHKEGLIKELNKQGINVIVITPTEISEKNS